jgi:hypothetical protein
MKQFSVQYLLEVTAPSDRLGVVGQIRHDLPAHAVDDLVDSGHVKLTESNTVAKGALQHEDKINARGPKRSIKPV